MSPIILIGAGIIVLVLGIGLGLWIGNIGRGKEKARTAEVQAELENYRREVSEHFKTTAVHFESIGAEYRRLYEHMAAGAGSLFEMRPAVFETPVEKLAVQEADEEAPPTPPRDYEEPVAAEETLSAREPDIAEPTDEELELTEKSDELLAEHDIPSEPAETEKTIH